MTQNNPNAPQPVSPTPPADDRPHQPADDSEEIYFHGSPLLRGEVGKLMGWMLAAVVLIAIPIASHFQWPGKLPWFVGMGLILLALAAALVPVIAVRSVRYRISNYRIDYERGILSKNIDTLELWHVEDISFHQSLLDRMLGVGTITIVSHDDTTPRLRLAGVPNPRPLFETLKQRVIAVKRQRGVIKMDVGN